MNFYLMKFSKTYNWAVKAHMYVLDDSDPFCIIVNVGYNQW